jgi:GntR family transcriptional regulator
MSELAIKVTGDSLHHGLGTKVRVVSIDKMDPPGRVADVLAGTAQSKVLRVVRIHELNGVAVSVVISYLPGELDAIVTAKDLETTTMHELLWRKGRLHLEKSVHTIRIVRADEKVATLLRVSLAEPVLHVQAEAYLDTGRPIWVTDNYFREDSYEYRAEMFWSPPATSDRSDMSGAWVGRGAEAMAPGLGEQVRVRGWQRGS